MCPRTTEQFEEIRENMRRRIIVAAIECFATMGYHACSISDLAKHAGISKGLMYNYFSGKEDLLRNIFREIMDEMMQLIDPEQSGKMDMKALKEYFDRLISHLKSNLLFWKMHLAIFSQPAVQQILNDEILDASAQPLKMIEEYFRKHGFREPELEVAFLSTLMSGITFEYISDPVNYPLDRIKERVLTYYYGLISDEK
jgi:AcrR family transcriptional regulator